MNDEKCDVPHVRCLANVGEEGGMLHDVECA